MMGFFFLANVSVDCAIIVEKMTDAGLCVGKP